MGKILTTLAADEKKLSVKSQMIKNS